MWRAVANAARRAHRSGPLNPHVAPAARRHAAVDGFTMPTPQLLSEIVKLESFAKETPEACREIWNAHHADETQRRLGVTLSAEDWTAVQTCAHSNPRFVLPVPKGGGAFVTFYLQWQLPHLLFTLLDEVQRGVTNARPHLVISHYPDLAAEKGLVFARGEVPSPDLNMAEARQLVALAHAFYSEPAKQRTVAAFNRALPEFSFAEVQRACGVEPTH